MENSVILAGYTYLLVLEEAYDSPLSHPFLLPYEHDSGVGHTRMRVPALLATSSVPTVYVSLIFPK